MQLAIALDNTFAASGKFMVRMVARVPAPVSIELEARC